MLCEGENKMPEQRISEPKRLPPSMRSKARYVVFEIISELPVDFNDFVKALWNSAGELLGDLTASEARVWVVRNLYDQRLQRGVLKCAHDRVEHMRAALALVKAVGENRAIIHVVGVTGTIKAARNKYLGQPDLTAAIQTSLASKSEARGERGESGSVMQ